MHRPTGASREGADVSAHTCALAVDHGASLGRAGGTCEDPTVRAPDVSIVVVNYRTPELTAQALADARAAAGDLEVELVAVDSGSGDGSADALAPLASDAQIVALETNRGYAAALNAGIDHATARNVLLLNSDALARGDAVARLVAYADAQPRAGVVAPGLEHEDGSRQVNAYRRFPNLLTLFADFCLPLHLLGRTSWHPHQLPPSQFASARRVAHVLGAAMLVRRDAAAAAGALDEGYFLYLEETEWQRRIAGAGWEIHLEPAARFVHVGQASDASAQVISDHYVDSALRYYRSPAAALWVMRAGTWISLVCARAAARLRPRDPRFPRLVQAFSRLRSGLKARQPSSVRR